MSETPLRAEFFVTRNEGNMIPLVAVDELPHHITIEGVSRVMSPFDIAGMTCVGRSEFRHRQYTVEIATELAATNRAPGRDPLKAKYFVTRDSGNMVPLVAMDEMPAFFEIKSVPRIVDAFSIARMTCVGVSNVREQTHTVEDVKNAPISYFAGRTLTGHGPEAAISPPKTPEQKFEPAIAQNTPEAINNPQLSTPPQNQSAISTPPASVNNIQQSNISLQHLNSPSTAFTNVFVDECDVPVRSMSQMSIGTPASIASANMIAAPGTKEYCSYWLRHGECDYQQQGCLYKHEMPLDKESLTRLGLRDIPRWYREKHSLGSYLAAGGAGAAFSGEGLKSAAASGIVEVGTPSRVSNNWRTPPRGSGYHSTPPATGRRGNLYNPRSGRFNMNPSSFSRNLPATPQTPLRNGKLRSNETLHSRQQFEALQALNTYAQLNEARHNSATSKAKEPANADDADVSASEGASEVGSRRHRRRRSASTIISDIEALVSRQDHERRSKESDEYAKIVEVHNAKVAAEKAKAEAEAKSDSVADGRRGAVAGPRRTNRNAHGRGRPKKAAAVAGKANGAA